MIQFNTDHSTRQTGPVFSSTVLVMLLLALSGCNTIAPLQALVPSSLLSDATTYPPPEAEAPFTSIEGNPPKILKLAAVSTPPGQLRMQQKPAIWQTIRNGYQLSPKHLPQRVTRFRQQYLRKPEYLATVFERARPFIHYITHELHRAGMPLEIALLPIIESAYDPLAYSSSHAVGLWQFIPTTGEHYGLARNRWYDGRRDVVASTAAAMTYLQYLHNLFDDDWLLALAAYNAGEGFLAKRIAQSRAAGKSGDFWSLKLWEETYNYVPKLLALADLVKNPQHYGINLPHIPNRPYFEKILLDAPIELTVLAQAADLSTTELGHLNPAFRRSFTPPNGPFTVLIPVDRSVELQRFLSSNDRPIWRAQKEYAVVAGDTLSGIAQRHQVRTSWLKQTNKLQSERLSIGQILLIPNSDEPLSDGAIGRSTRYRVIAGDTLSGIAEKFNTPMSKLRRNNDLTSDVVRIGQTLEIPSEAARPVVVRKVFYRVKNGDSLSVIASAFGVKVSDVIRWNGIARSDILQPKQKLMIFIDPHRQ